MDIISITQPIVKFKNSIDDSDNESDIDMDDEDDDNLHFSETATTNVETGKTLSAGLIQDRSIVTPGELITDDPTWMRGHGTYYLNSSTYSSVAGTISRVNKLLSVIPFKGRYKPETGDHIIGRIVEVGNKRWKVSIGGEHDAVLMLGSVNLPGGVLRRKSESDELQMRNFLKEGDLLNAEVQTLFQDGSGSLHTRSLKYGKLRNGIFVMVPSNLIIRSKNHSHDLPGNVSVILGVNGFCWISKTIGGSKLNTSSLAAAKAEAGLNSSSSGSYKIGQGSVSITRLEEESSWDIYSDKNDEISDVMKDTISRYKNCLLALSYCNIGINETRLVKAYEISLGYGEVNNLVGDDIKLSIGEDLISSEKMRG